MTSNNSFQDYSKVANLYDKHRKGFGYEIIFGALSKYAYDKPLFSLNILEAGCGTGNTTREICNYVGHVTAVDCSDDMIAIAEDKLSDKKNVSFKNLDLRTSLPYESNKFDGVLLIQVAHHLDEIGPDGVVKTENLQSLITEFNRVLKREAPLIMAVFSPRQITRCMWYYHLAMEKGFCDVMLLHSRRFLPLEIFSKICKEKHFENEKIIVPVSELVFDPEYYFDPKSILSKEFRSAQSGLRDFEKSDKFPLLMTAYQESIETNEVQEYIRQSECIRAKEGMITFLIYNKECY
ncbi:hypothetical protein LOD99_9491 [Oopsacas minuta]|uniref:Methyltransferase type 11 domain-containing protein n=1 Tax=Oopsacas minuta TaxID=111878 RepID=A0AAV7JBK5_9METZ|nr:hypothetical protein LOD99_9491 [Oopsacas minuta]